MLVGNDELSVGKGCGPLTVGSGIGGVEPVERAYITGPVLP